MDRGDAVRGLAHDLHVVRRLDEDLQGSPHERLVVGDEHAGGHESILGLIWYSAEGRTRKATFAGAAGWSPSRTLEGRPVVLARLEEAPMSRTSARTSVLAASAAFLLVPAAGPAPASAAAAAAPIGPVVTAPRGGDVQPAARWTWPCQGLGGFTE